MSAPRYVPTQPAARVRAYQSPPRRPTSWRANRPGDLPGRQPTGERLGAQGPDQGYALVIARSLAPSLHLVPGEHLVDVMAGGVAVATKRASLFGRAPMVDDLEVAFAIWGFDRRGAPEELIELRRELFEECHHPHFYDRLRRIADLVPAELLAKPADEAIAQVTADWRTGLPELA